jgi:hypothetical protein
VPAPEPSSTATTIALISEEIAAVRKATTEKKTRNINPRLGSTAIHHHHPQICLLLPLHDLTHASPQLGARSAFFFLFTV